MDRERESNLAKENSSKEKSKIEFEKLEKKQNCHIPDLAVHSHLTAKDQLRKLKHNRHRLLMMNRSRRHSPHMKKQLDESAPETEIEDQQTKETGERYFFMGGESV